MHTLQQDFIITPLKERQKYDKIDTFLKIYVFLLAIMSVKKIYVTYVIGGKMIKKNKIIQSLVLLLALVSCTNEQTKIKNYQIDIIRKANQINKDFQVYLSAVEYLADYTVSLYENQDKILPTIDKSKYIKHPTGVLYSVAKVNESVVFVTGHKPITENVKKPVYFTEKMDSVFIYLKDNFKDVSQLYYNDRNSFNRIYPPFDVLLQYQPNTDITNFKFYYLANEKFNPERRALWVDEPYLDPAGKGWLISAIAPVYYKNRLEGVVGIDITIDNIYKKWIKQKEGNQTFIISSSGLVVAADKNATSLLQLPNINNPQYLQAVVNEQLLSSQLNLTKSKFPEIRSMSQKILEGEKYFITNIGNDTFYVLCERITQMNWILVYLIKK